MPLFIYFCQMANHQLVKIMFVENRQKFKLSQYSLLVIWVVLTHYLMLRTETFLYIQYGQQLWQTLVRCIDHWHEPLPA